MHFYYLLDLEFRGEDLKITVGLHPTSHINISIYKFKLKV
jgi:hypothetical protein